MYSVFLYLHILLLFRNFLKKQKTIETPKKANTYVLDSSNNLANNKFRLYSEVIFMNNHLSKKSIRRTNMCIYLIKIRKQLF